MPTLDLNGKSTSLFLCENLRGWFVLLINITCRKPLSPRPVERNRSRRRRICSRRSHRPSPEGRRGTARRCCRGHRTGTKKYEEMKSINEWLYIVKKGFGDPLFELFPANPGQFI